MKSNLNRRDFAKLSAAAFGGMLAGTVGCSKGDKQDAKYDDALLMQEPHVCRGLNTCKGKGKGENACAGQGACATAEKHDCNALNTCKGQGGCGERPGENGCKEKGACGVPLSDKAWKKARTHFEAVMKKAGKEVAAAPEK